LLPVSKMQSREGPWMEARSQPEAWWIQQRSWTRAAGAGRDAAGLGEAEQVQQEARAGVQTAMRPWRSPAARRSGRWSSSPRPASSAVEAREGALAAGAQRTAVTKEASEEAEEEGMGRTQRSCMKRGSETTTLLPAPCARRPEVLRSMQPPLPSKSGRWSHRAWG
jgi:hypothetical protein